MLARGRCTGGGPICTPPQARYGVARRAPSAAARLLEDAADGGRSAELDELRELAQSDQGHVFCAWHSQFAPAVSPAREWLAPAALRRVRITWREDVRVWHPGQRWLWEPGGFGVFDPGINALSVAAKMLPKRYSSAMHCSRFPVNCATPIAAELTLTDPTASRSRLVRFFQTGPQTWDIESGNRAGNLLLTRAAARLPSTAQVPLPPEQNIRPSTRTSRS